MLRADAVVDAVEPGLQIGEDEVDHRHELFGHFGVARHARRLAGDEVSGPEPDAERRMTALHDGADQETGLAAARTALQNTWSGDNAEGLGDQAAMRADKAVRPAGTPKIG